MPEDKTPHTLTELAGMPIMTQETGKRLGNVKDIIFDPRSGKLEALTIESSGFFGPHRRFVLMSDIRSIGEDAIMIESGRVLRMPEDTRRCDDIVNRGMTLIGKTVVTEDGSILGSISDVIIEPDTGQAQKYEVSGGTVADVQTGRRTFAIPGALVVGPDAVVVPDSVEQHMESEPAGGLAGAYAGTREGAVSFWARVKDWWDNVTQSAIDKEAEFSLGKIAGATVTDDAGNVIVNEGDEITQRDVVRARVAGKVHQLALAAGWGVTRKGYEAAKESVTTATEEQEARYVLGKKAGRTVRDDQGNVIVGKDEQIDQQDVDRARQAGKLGDLTAAVTGAGARGITEAARERVTGTAEEYGKRRLTAQQREMALGKVSATDVRDDQGKLLIEEGEIFTPMILDELEQEGRLDQIRLMPVMGPEKAHGEVEVPRIELLVCSEDAHRQRE